MSDRAPPAFQFYPSEWFARARRLSIDGQAALVNLMAEAWRAAEDGHPPCTIPDDDESLAELSGLGARWAKVARALRQQFTPVDGRLRDERLHRYWMDLMEHRARRSAAGKRGNLARWGDEDTEASPPMSYVDRNAIASRSDRDPTAIANDRSMSLSLSSSLAVRDRSSSGAERVVRASPCAAAPAPLAALPDAARELLSRFYAHDDARRGDVAQQLLATLEKRGAKIRAGVRVRARDAEHLADVCRAVAEEPPDDGDLAIYFVLLKLQDPIGIPAGRTVTEHASAEARRREQLEQSYQRARNDAVDAWTSAAAADALAALDAEVNDAIARRAERRGETDPLSDVERRITARHERIQAVAHRIDFPTADEWIAARVEASC